MSLLFRPSTPDDSPQIAALLAGSHRLPPQSTLTDPSELAWKYWTPFGGDATPRSFVLDRAGVIVAHAGTWPHQLNGETGGLLFDWVRDASTPGVGAAIVQHLKGMLPFVSTIGGSDAARQVLPKLGFATVHQASVFARPLRPWLQARLHQRQDRRLPLRFVRNSAWAILPATSAGRGWTSVEVGPDDRLPDVMGNRGGAFVRYLLGCPTVPVRAWHVVHNGQRVGLFALAVVEAQARLLGVWMQEPSVGRWAVAYRLAQRVARRELSAAELTARSSDAAMCAGAVASGLRLIEQTDVVLYRRGGAVNGLILPCQLWDREAFLLNEGTSFLT